MDFRKTLSEGEWATIRAALLVAQDKHLNAKQALVQLAYVPPLSEAYQELIDAHMNEAQKVGSLYSKLEQLEQV